MTDRRSPLHAAHEGAGARTTTFGGWTMPVSFDSITAEHEAVRTTVGRFDVSHMGQLAVDGPDATELAQRLVTNDVGALDPGEACYAAVTTDEGIMLDDVLVYRLPAEETRYLVVPNAGNDATIADRFRHQCDQWDLGASITNLTAERGMLAIQGPGAIDRVADAVDGGLTGLDRFECVERSIDDVAVLVARTGYTGEDGVELIVPWGETEHIWSVFEDVVPCGLGARDTLRLEAGFLLSGQDFHPESNPRTPYEAGIGFAVKLDTDFVGRDALEQDAAEGTAEQLVGIRLVDRGVPRAGYSITDPDGTPLGTVTSGTMSPTLSVPIALGYVPAEVADPGTRLRVVIRDEPKKAKIESTPFVDSGQ